MPVLRALAIACALAMPGAAQSLVKDINVAPPVNNPGQREFPTLTIDDRTFFTANDELHGTELWLTDCTSAGTRLVLDLTPGSASSRLYLLGPVAGQAAFFVWSADPGLGGLWRSDGTRDGTTRLGNPLGWTAVPALLRDEAFYVVRTSSNELELRAMNALHGLERTVHAALPGSPTGREIVRAGGRLWFDLSPDLWSSDGTTAGTIVVAKNVWLTATSVPILAATDGTVYFAAVTSQTGAELWRSDGTLQGTFLLKDIEPYGGSNPTDFVELAGCVFFRAWTRDHGTELWRTDGTSVGTTIVRDLDPGSASGVTTPLAPRAGRLFFGGSDGSGARLWSSDGTAPGTMLVGGPPDPDSICVLGGTVFLRGAASPARRVLWRSDGTSVALVRDVVVSTLVPARDRLLFLGAEAGGALEPWCSDGSSNGTCLLRDINPGLPNGSSIAPLASRGNELFFCADDGVHGAELWISDGSGVGTRLVKDVWPGTTGSTPLRAAMLSGELFFGASDPVLGTELWRSDGTESGTRLAAEVTPGPHSTDFGQLLVVNGVLFFTVNRSSPAGVEIWRSDGTSAGTCRIRDACYGAPCNAGAKLADLEGTLMIVFTFQVGSAFGTQIWRSDGTAAGTVLVKSILDQTPIPSGAFVACQRLWLLTYSPSSTFEIWRSDGTSAGTASVFRRSAFAVSSALATGDAIYFAEYGSPALWRLDARAEIASRLHAFGMATRTLARIGEAICFPGHDSTLGTELWISDGTPAGTRLVNDIRQGPWSGYEPDRVAPFATTGSNRVFFPANDGDSGPEPWVSDGTWFGTRRLADLCPGPKGSTPNTFASAGTNVFFVADDGVHGMELFALDLREIGGALAQPFGQGCGIAMLPRVSATGVPTLGNAAFAAELRDARAGAPMLWLTSLARRDLPFGDGCAVHVAIPAPMSSSTTDALGRASLALPIPASPAFAGIELFLQSAIADPTSVKGGGLALSDALQVLIGR